MYQYSSQMYGTEWESYMGITNLAKVVSSEQLCVDPTKSPFNIVTTPLQTPPGFCATRSLVSFQAQQHDQIEVPAWCFEFPKTTTTTTTIDSGDNFTSTKQDLPSSQFTSSLLCPVAESFLSSNSSDCPSSSEKYCKFACSEKYSDIQPDSVPYYDQFSQDDKLLRDDAATDERPLEISFQRNQLVSCRKREKQGPRQHCGGACLTSSNSAFRRGKRRIKWTKDLHEPFMMIVKSLGGPEKAKPKAILEMMKSDLLSISHVKSHLQKCRSTIHMHKDLQERSEEGHKTDEVAELQVKIQMQIEESRQLQLEVRRNICQQLEMQRNLQVLIEQQSQQLKVMLDYQKERTKQEKNP
ncbi:protein PHOSPHATE STARVATION RESPONSE 1 isoform X2 [Cajanus cajan]|uniref:protein PHOSPHATE STARVATION RESPONSE 1 isoform X2 n=1 Tax=Cajanus cajan TaxID=3821 RepID=UPI00098DB816|nr:protein PHOSPHATE STARVATION RESPONSE 1 isoform X2 [Cajanus cajan]